MEGGINAEGGERHGHSQHKISWSWDGLKISMWEARTRESKMDQSHNGTRVTCCLCFRGFPMAGPFCTESSTGRWLGNVMEDGDAGRSWIPEGAVRCGVHAARGSLGFSRSQ